MKVYRNGREVIIAKDPGTPKWGKFQPRKPQGYDPDDEDEYERFKEAVANDFERGWNQFIREKELPKIDELTNFYHTEFSEDFEDYLEDLIAEVESMRSADFYGWLIDLEAN